MQCRVAGHGLEQSGDLDRRGWTRFNGLGSRRGRLICDVVEDPRPTLRLGQGGMEDGVNPADRANGQRFAIGAAVGSQTFVEGVHHDGRQVTDQEVAKTGLEMAIDDRLQVADRRRRPAGSTMGEPQVQRFANRGTATNRRSNVGVRCEGLELSASIGPIAVHGSRRPAAAPRTRIRCGVDPELVGVTPPLAYGTLRCVHCHSVAVMGN